MSTTTQDQQSDERQPGAAPETELASKPEGPSPQTNPSHPNPSESARPGKTEGASWQQLEKARKEAAENRVKARETEQKLRDAETRLAEIQQAKEAADRAVLAE